MVEFDAVVSSAERVSRQSPLTRKSMFFVHGKREGLIVRVTSLTVLHDGSAPCSTRGLCLLRPTRTVTRRVVRDVRYGHRSINRPSHAV